MAIFCLQPIHGEGEVFKHAKTTTWFGKHIPIPLLILSNFLKETLFLCDPKPRHLISSFLDIMETLAPQENSNGRKCFSNWNRIITYT